MKKKLLLLFFAIVAIVCLAFGFSACGKSNGNPFGSSSSSSTLIENDSSSGSSSFDEADYGNENPDAYGGLEYTLSDDGTYYIVSGIVNCTDTDITIPSTYNDIAVCEIGDYAFYGCTSLTSVTIGDSVETIGDYAFYNCTSLTSATIGVSVTSIGTWALCNCTALTEINFNATAMDDLSWDSIVFYMAGQSGDGITVNMGANVTKIPAHLFYPDSSSNHAPNITSVVFEEDSVCESIGDYAFYICTSLKSITIPDSVTNIGNSAFYYCTSLTNVYYDGTASQWASILFDNQSANPLYHGNLYINGELATDISIEGITTINDYAFYNCTAFTSITIGESIKSIGSSVFYECTALKEINFNATAMDDSSNNDIFYNAGQSGDGITVTIGANVTEIPAYLFYPALSIYGAKITNVVFENDSKCESIGSYAFYGCISLTSVTIPDSVTSIGNGAFGACYSLISITIGDSVTSIGDSAFWNCSSLTDIIIPDSVTSIGSRAFGACYSLISIIIPDSVTSIGNFAFYECTALTEIYFNATAIEDLSSDNKIFCNSSQSCDEIMVTIGANVTQVPAYLFYGYFTYTGARYYAPNITSVVFEDGSVCESIGEYAFYHCTSLKSITIPESVISIGYAAFSSCTALTEINFNATTMKDLSSNNYVFASAGKGGDGITVTIGADVTKIPAYLFYPDSSSISASNITSVVFKDGCVCESIGSYAFYNCTSLTSVYYSGTACEWASISFSNNYANPLYYAGNLYINGTLLSDLADTSIKTISDYAFAGWNTTSVTLPETIVSIGYAAFSDCTALTEINYNVTAMQDLSEYNYAFNNVGQNIGGVAVTIGANVTKIPDYLFYSESYSSAKASNITSVVFEDGSVCESIGCYAFAKCASLTCITIPESVSSISGGAFYGCTALTEINFNATAMDDLSSNNYVFYGAGQNGDGITVTIGANVLKIPAYLFCPSYSGSNYVPNIASVVFEDNSVCTSMGSYAFWSCTLLTSVYYNGTASEWASISFEYYYDNPLYYVGNLYLNGELATDISIEGITTINDYAFYNCTSLTSVTIGESITSIGYYAFCICYKLVEVYNLSSLTITAGDTDNGYVGYYAKNIYTLGSGESYLVNQDGYTFYNDNGKYYLVDYTGSETALILPTFTINDEILNYSIYRYAFMNNSSLTSITIPDSVTSIGDYAFGNCASLTSVTIPDSVTSIGDYAFYNCASLTSVTISDSVTFIGNSVFYCCTSLTSITIPDSVTFIGGWTFGYCSSLLNITIPDSVTSIGNYAFYFCTSLKNVIIPDSVTSIGDNAFYYCISLESVTIGNSVKTIGDSAFHCCISLTNITIPDSVTLISNDAFSICTSLTSIIIPNSVTSIGDEAFSWCTSLTSITVGSGNMNYKSIDGNLYSYDGTEFIQYAIGKTDTSFEIPDGVTSIKSWAFENCDSLTRITIPDSVTSIGGEAFGYCSSLLNITIPDTITSIGDYVFSYCTSLESIVIPDSVTSISDYAFEGCYLLSTVYYTGTAEEWRMITIGSDNSYLTSAMLYYYSANEPDYTDGYNYWYYNDDGEIVVWTQSTEE